MKLNYKAAVRFAQSLSVVQLRLVVAAYAQGAQFEDVFAQLEKSDGRYKSLSPYLRKMHRLLEKKPRTAAELAKLLKIKKDAVWSYVTKLRKAGVPVLIDRQYRQTTYRIETKKPE